jgi:hypothetical protein
LLLFDGLHRVVETVSGADRMHFSHEGGGAFALAVWSPDGRLFARGLSDGTVMVFDIASGRELLRRNGGQGSLVSLAFSRDGRKLATSGQDTTVLVWSVPAPGPLPRVPGLKTETAWRELQSSDAHRAFRAMNHLVGSPEEVLKLVKERLKPRPPADANKIARLIEGLDSDVFAEREQASRDLEEIGPPAEEALKKATQSPSVEVKRRAEDLLRKLRGGSGVAPDRLQAQRAVEVLERIGTAEARKALEALLKARLDSALEGSIKGALERLGEGG